MRSVNSFCGQPIKSDHVFFNMSFRHVYVFGLQFLCSCSCPYRGHDSPSSRSIVQNMQAILSSGVGSDRTRPNRLDLWNLNGSDPIGSDRSFEFRCRTAARPERKGTANLLPIGQGSFLTFSHLLEGRRKKNYSIQLRRTFGKDWL